MIAEAASRPSLRDISSFEKRKGRDGNFAAPTVVLIGEKDDWVPAAECTKMMAEAADNAAWQEIRRLLARSIAP
jgi:dienelactone hydrolase